MLHTLIVLNFMPYLHPHLSISIILLPLMFLTTIEGYRCSVTYIMVENFCGVLIFIIFVVHSPVMKISIHENSCLYSHIKK